MRYVLTYYWPVGALLRYRFPLLVTFCAHGADRVDRYGIRIRRSPLQVGGRAARLPGPHKVITDLGGGSAQISLYHSIHVRRSTGRADTTPSCGLEFIWQKRGVLGGD